MTLVLRPARPKDAGLILTMVRGLAAYEELEHRVELSEADIARDFFGDNPRVFCVLAEWDGQPAGFAVWYYIHATFRGRHGIYVEDLFVDTAFRGKGIGKALLAHLAARCAAEDLPILQWVVLTDNEPAIGFYTALGAEPQKEWMVMRASGDALATMADGAS